jgi:hypothetical protein
VPEFIDPVFGKKAQHARCQLLKTAVLAKTVSINAGTVQFMRSFWFSSLALLHTSKHDLCKVKCYLILKGQSDVKGKTAVTTLPEKGKRIE